MRRIMTACILMFLITAGAVSGTTITDDCTCKGIKLYGKVKIVNSDADIRVQIVDSFPDLNVRLVNSFPYQCGEWKIVSAFPDFTIQIVNSFPDLKVKFVDAFPGK
ncbi:MAG: hypothetical protein JW807_14230 [Spirochaetes bacterium]|nr:hypothetical protein [Spirochaetota bacterium]